MALLSYSDLLTIATAETERLTKLVEALDTELYQMSCHYLRMGWNKGFSDYYRQRREVYTKKVYAQADLSRSKAHEAILRKRIAAGEVRAALAFVAA